MDHFFGVTVDHFQSVANTGTKDSVWCLKERPTEDLTESEMKAKFIEEIPQTKAVFGMQVDVGPREIKF